MKRNINVKIVDRNLKNQIYKLRELKAMDINKLWNVLDYEFDKKEKSLFSRISNTKSN